MFLDEIIRAQKRGEARGIASICSAHPWVLKAALELARDSGAPALIEATCNQVNQFGGYTGMRPRDFADYVRRIAEETGVPFEQVILGGDHLGPSAWQGEPAESAMGKAEELVREYVRAGFVKIHLDCSMRLADDPPGPLDREVSARRAARLAKAAERLSPAAGTSPGAGPRYVIGSEVPLPGGALQDEETVSVTSVESASETLRVTREAFLRGGLGSTWERVIALVVQPGIEFGDDFVLPYRSAGAQELARFIEDRSMVYEAHSTDYQTRAALGELVRDHFAILKVGPRLTFAFREAIFALALIEAELVRPAERSNILQVIEDAMLRSPVYWEKYYRGDPAEQAFKRKFSLSDRIRYYWPDPQVDEAVKVLIRNLGARAIPPALLSQFVPVQGERIRLGEPPSTPSAIILDHIQAALGEYQAACNPPA
jgi:D-tagatose-1,6-bisphosphate aldolase subunit GatZ/KbaZ